MPFSMSDIVNDPDFAQSFVITRDGGSWVNGVWVAAPTPINGYGVIQPSTDAELDQVPEGDRVKGMVTFHSSSPIFETNPNGISDVIAWNNQTYRIVKVWPWQDFGYYKAIGARMSGQ